MKEVEVLLPKMGESVAEATITKWLKKVGDKIEAEESLVEIATDKVDSEIPSPASGIIEKIFFKEGEVAKVGQAIAIIASEAAGTQKSPEKFDVIQPEPQSIPPSNGNTLNPELTEVVSHQPVERVSSSGRFYSPLVRNIAKREQITLVELESISGSGKSGRVTKHDILAYLPSRSTRPSVVKTETAETISTTKSYTPQHAVSGDNVEIIEMDRMRKLIADHMVMSKHTSPHVTSFVEADVTNIVLWREKMKKMLEQRDGEKLTFTPVFVEAAVKALKDFPLVNSSLDGYKIIRKKYINIGIAAALPSGNLIVPVIKNANHFNLLGLTKAVNDLARRARENKLTPDEIQGGTFTLSNVGTFGNVMGTPIINQPQVAILATGVIKKKPAVLETPSGDTIAIRHLMFLSLSYDHRIVDGALGGRYLRKVADYLESFDIATLI